MSIHSQYSAASNETLIEDYVNSSSSKKRAKTAQATTTRGAYGSRAGRNKTNMRQNHKQATNNRKIEPSTSEVIGANITEAGTTNGAESGEERRIGGGRVDCTGTNEDPLVRQFCIRMKSTLTKRGCQHFKSSGYRVVHVVAHLRSYQSNDHGHLMDPLDDPLTSNVASGLLSTSASSSKSSSKKRGASKLSTSNTSTPGPSTLINSAADNNKELIATTDSNREQVSKESNETNTIGDSIYSGERAASKPKIIGLVAVAIALPPPSINELRLESGTFVLRLSLDLKVTHIEPKITELLNYPVESIAGRSLYSLIHPADVCQVQKCHKDLLKKGQMMSGYYRLLAQSGGYIWIQTCATLICNNNFGNQTVVASSSPMPSNSANSSAHATPSHVGHDNQHKIVPNYLAPPAAISLPTSSQYNIPSGNHSRIVSPGVSSHLSSNYDTQDQDQCVIFVNYMITDILERNEILDICQSTNYSQSSSFSGSNTNNNTASITTTTTATTTTTNNNNNNLNNLNVFNSPASSCSSPCLSGPLKNNTSNYGISSNHGTSSLSPSRRSHTGIEAKHKIINGRKHSNTTTKTKSQLYLSNNNIAEENGHVSANLNNNSLQFTNVLEQVKGDNQQIMGNNLESLAAVAVAAGSNEILAPSNVGVYSYPQSQNSVNIANNKTNETSSWLASAGHHQSAGSTRLNESGVMVYRATNQAQNHHHYPAMNRSSIYKAAFGLSDVNSTSYNHHQQPAMYHQPSSTNYTSPASVSANTWADSATVAAVAAASNLTNHHHHAAAVTNPYVHLEPHHHHTQTTHNLSSAAAAASVASNHHTNSAAAANTYYNYYGYYGNKFI